MSKSKGNVVDPLSLIETLSPDAFRYFLMREMQVGQDSNFSYDLFLARYHSELGNDLGNLLSRLLHMLHAYADGTVPPVQSLGEAETKLRETWETILPKIVDDYQGFDFSGALEATFSFLKALNRYTEQKAPWKLAKAQTAEARQDLHSTLASMAEGLRLCAVVLAPVMPQVAHTIQTLLGTIPATQFEGALAWSTTLAGKKVGEKTILFPRVEKPADGV